jgi:hypothetical protein
MNMFGRGPEQSGGQSGGKQQIEFPELQEFEVMMVRYDSAQGNVTTWEKVQGHNAQIVDGCLMIFRGIFIDENCTQPSAVPAGFYAPGEWRRCKTDYQGFQRKSELAIH